MVKNLSVFFPCYNEEETIEETVKKSVSVLEKLNLEYKRSLKFNKLNYEILIINDGSTDKTKEVAESLAKQNFRIKLINHEKNLGYGEALKSGFKLAKYDTIVYNDGDGQFDFSEVDKFLDKIPNTDLLVGFRIKRKDHPVRVFFAKGWALSLWLFFGLRLKDVDCGFKMIKRQTLDKIGKLQSSRGGMINAELAIKTKKAGLKIEQIGVHHFPRLAGKPTGANIAVIVSSYLDLLKLWWKLLNKLHFFLSLGILGLAAFLRFYRLPEYMTFLGDEGRDAIVIKDLLVGHHFPFIGPPTSIGNIYLGPLYYYMMAAPMSIFWLNPVAAAAQVAVIGVLTVALIYYLGKKWFGFWAGATASFLYSISPVTIIYSRSSWNPNPAPFFSLLAILGFYKVHKSGNFRWLALTGAAVAFAIQMHYLALILLPIFGILWVIEVSLLARKKLSRSYFLSGTLTGIVIFFLLMSPLFIFDFRHNFMNFRAIQEFFFNRETTVNINPINSLGRIPPIYIHNLVGRYMAGDFIWSNWLVSILILVPFALRPLRFVYLALGIWLFVGLAGLSLYKQNIYDHYLGFLNPVPYLLFGSLLSFNKKWLMWGMGGLILLLAAVNLQKLPLQNPPNRQLQRTQDIAKFVIAESADKPFNFALITKSNYDSAYQFYLDLYGHKPEPVQVKRTDQLFVVCEDPVCNPINHPKYEIAGFGWAKIEKEQEFLGVKVFKLVANPSGRP